MTLLGLCVTGTDTGVGKTTVAVGIVRALRAVGVPVAVSKPVATGDIEDTRRLAEAAGLGPEAWGAVTPWRFDEPLAPAVAARRAGVRLKLADLVVAARRQARDGAVLVVEGAGGLLCPLADDGTCAELFEAIGCPMIVVARRSLGTLNHTMLTVEAASRRSLAVAGVVVSEVTPPAGVADETNVDELRRLLSVPVLAVLDHGSAEDGAKLAAIDWRRLAGPMRLGP